MYIFVVSFNRIYMSEQKQTIIKVIRECYEKSRKKNFQGLNVSLVPGETLYSVIKQNCKLLELIDENSETYKSLLNIARKALNELKDEKLDFHYKNLLEHFCSIPFDVIVNKKSVKISEKESKKTLIQKEAIVPSKNTKKEIYLTEDITGKKLEKINQEIKEAEDFDIDEFEESEDVELSENNFEGDEDIELEGDL